VRKVERKVVNQFLGRQPPKKTDRTSNKRSSNVSVATEPRSVIGKLANSVGSVFGSDFGSVGGKVGDFFSGILGMGDYEVKSNSIVEGLKSGSDPPLMHSSSDSVVIRHREYIGDVSATTDFSTTTWAVNPGLCKSFPWLSALAENYQQYRWKGLVFEYKNTSSPLVSSTSTAMGAVILASQYNVYAPMFTSKQQIDNNEWTTTAKPCESFMHPVECDPGQVANNLYYVRTGATPSGQDARLYDMLYFTVATVGMQSSSLGVLGEIWATYEVELFKPVLNSAMNFALPYYAANASGVITNPLNGLTAVINTFPLVLTYASTTPTWSIPAGFAGTYALYIRMNAASGAWATLSPTFTFTNAAVNTSLIGLPPSISQLCEGGNTGDIAIRLNFNILNPSARTVINWTNYGNVIGSVGGTLNSFFEITQLNGLTVVNNNSTLLTMSSSIGPVKSKSFENVEEEKEPPVSIVDEDYEQAAVMIMPTPGKGFSLVNRNTSAILQR